jgi:acyl-CoA reductase-like NAD-dependent aldehyde dehydrogenase
VTLELGGNAAVIVHEDADREYAAERITWGATVQSGQTCISVQRVYAHESLDGFAEELAERFKGLVIGDPLDDATDIGPLIDTEAADRVEAWLAEAVDAGARVLTGGGREGNTIEPTVLVDLRVDMKVSCEEAFAPLVGVYRYGDVREAIRAAGDSEFGLQGGLFTNDLRVIDHAFDEIEVGGLMVNDVSTFRVDHMPYGGVKSSGAGREGLRYAIEEMTEMKLLTFNSRGGL